MRRRRKGRDQWQQQAAEQAGEDAVRLRCSFRKCLSWLATTTSESGVVTSSTIGSHCKPVPLTTPLNRRPEYTAVVPSPWASGIDADPPTSV